MTRRKFLFQSLMSLTLAILMLTGALFGQTPLPSNDYVPGSWTLVLLPDTQKYAKSNPGLFTLQTDWIAQNKEKYNICYVVGLGDITNDNTDIEWQRARDAYARLDGKVPYAIVPGNHDYTPRGDMCSGKSGMNDYFPVAKFKSWPTFGGVMQPGDIHNSYHLFSAGGVNWIILALEFGPRDTTVQWANEVLAKYPDRKAMMVTHGYMKADGQRNDHVPAGVSKGNAHFYVPDAPVNDGEELWQKLVSKHNVPLVFCGHVGAKGTGLLISQNESGQTVNQMLVDYQGRTLGGEAYLRILEFQPDGKTVHAKTYSPLYDKYLDDPNNQFSFQLAP
jgi:hypothetical protein